MVTIFKEIEQLRDFITIDVSSDLSVIMPYLKQAEKYVRNIIGDTLFEALIEFVNGEEPQPDTYTEEVVQNYTLNDVSDYQNITNWDKNNYPIIKFIYENKVSTWFITASSLGIGTFDPITGVITGISQPPIGGSITINNPISISDIWTVEHSGGIPEQLAELLPYCQLALANFGYFLAIDKLNVNVGNAGITVASTASLVPASKERIDRLRESVEHSGYDALEEIIKFLEKNIDDYPEWKDSDAYSYNKQFFINNAEEFYKTIHKQITRLQFLAIKEFIALAEIEIKGVVCVDLFAELKSEILSGDISDINKILLESIKPAVCYLSLNKQNEDTLYKNEAARLIETLRLFLNANAEDYPLYLESTCYSATIIADLNSDESGVFGFGL